jgi:hypothetical protein
MDGEDLTRRVRALRAQAAIPQADRPRPRRATRSRGSPGQGHRRSRPGRRRGTQARRVLGEPGVEPGAHRPGPPGVARRRCRRPRAQGLVSVLVTRQARHGRVRVCGWPVDVWCLGSRTWSARASWTSAARPSSPAPTSPPTRPHRYKRPWSWPSTWSSAPTRMRDTPASSPLLASRPPLGSWGRGPARAPSASGATACPSSSRAPTTTRQLPPPRRSAPSGGATSTS